MVTATSRYLHGARCQSALAFVLLLAILGATARPALAGESISPEYLEPKAVFDFFFADPRHINSGLFWLRSYMNPLSEAPYDYAPEMMDIVVVVHGTEIVTLAKHNYDKYREAVERMRYYASLGVKFRVCGLAAGDYDYDADTFYDFVEVIPSAMVEIADLQQRGYGLVMPLIHERTLSIDEIR